MTNLKNSLLAGFAFGLIFSLFLVFLVGSQQALGGGLLAGLVFGGLLYVFLNSKRVQQQTALTSQAQQLVIREGMANHFSQGEAAGGKLYLLYNQLYFKSHQYNFQNHELVIPLTHIKGVQFFNTLGLIPNGLEILTHSGIKERFVVNGRRKWKEAILSLI
ncbi:MAG: hypothetical protein U0Y10_06980 [Spirosomataceae bacterium]